MGPKRFPLQILKVPKGPMALAQRCNLGINSLLIIIFILLCFHCMMTLFYIKLTTRDKIIHLERDNFTEKVNILKINTSLNSSKKLLQVTLLNKPNTKEGVILLPEDSLYLKVANDSRSSDSGLVHIGSEDFKYPLLVDMVQLVRRVHNKQPINVAPINKQEFRFRINQPSLCQQPLSKPASSTVRKQGRQQPPPQYHPGIVLVIKSALGHFVQRQLIRETWGNFNCWPTGASVQRVFMVGRPKAGEPAASFETRLGAEARQHADVVQVDFVDHYFNNTLKMMASFSWIIANCNRARFAFFLDDDYVISPLNVMRFAEAIPEESYSGTMAGFVWRNAAPVRKAPKRNPQSRWLISYREYPWPMYPAYVSAGAFLVSMPIIQDFTVAMEYTRYLRFDDVFLGILMHKLRVAPLHAERIYSFNPVYPNNGEFANMIASHGYANSVDKVKNAWSEILNRTGAEGRLPIECVLAM